MKLPNPLLSSAQARPDHPALVTDTQILTYAQLVERVSVRAGGLKELGVTRGDRVALLGQFDADWVISFHAVGWIGAVVAPIAPTVTAATFRQNMTTAQVQFLLVGEGFERLADAFACPRGPIGVQGEQIGPVLWDMDEARAVVMTSGSTASPKAVVLTTVQWLYSAMGSSIRLGHHLDDRWLVVLPLHHVGGLSILVRAAWLATTVEIGLPFKLETVIERLENAQVTQISLVPEMLSRLLEQEGGPIALAKLRLILLGGDTCSDGLRERAEELALPVALTWGMSEAASQITTRLPGDLASRADVGAPLPFVRVSARAGDGRLIVRGPTVGGDVLVTSDVGAVDVEGRVSVLGRSDDIFISGGENVAPANIEAVLQEHPAVTDAVVVDVPDARWGARPLAFVVLMRLVEARELRNFIGERLDKFEVPDAIVACERLPVHGIGKVNRRELRSLAQRLVIGSETQLFDRAKELLGHITWLEGVQIDDDVDKLTGTPELPVLTDDTIAKGDRGLPNLGDGQLNSESLSKSHGPGIVGLGMDQGHAPTTPLEDICQATSTGHQELFESGVTVLINSTKEGDPCAVDLVESDSQYVFESHRCPHDESEGKER